MKIQTKAILLLLEKHRRIQTIQPVWLSSSGCGKENQSLAGLQVELKFKLAPALVSETLALCPSRCPCYRGTLLPLSRPPDDRRQTYSPFSHVLSCHLFLFPLCLWAFVLYSVFHSKTYFSPFVTYNGLMDIEVVLSKSNMQLGSLIFCAARRTCKGKYRKLLQTWRSQRTFF